MRKLLITLTAALVVLAGWTPAQATQGPSIHIKPVTSKIYQYDGSSSGTGPTFPATDVTAVVKHCPAGDYQMSATLRQNGVDMQWATGALGAGDVTCSGAAKMPLAMGFYGASLHPGNAKASFALYTWECTGGVCTLSDTPTVTATRTVHIPGHRCHKHHAAN